MPRSCAFLGLWVGIIVCLFLWLWILALSACQCVKPFSLPLGDRSKLGSPRPFPLCYFFFFSPLKDKMTLVTAVKWMEFSSYYLTGRSLDDNWTLMLTASLKSFIKHLTWGGSSVEWETALKSDLGDQESTSSFATK